MEVWKAFYFRVESRALRGLISHPRDLNNCMLLNVLWLIVGVWNRPIWRCLRISNFIQYETSLLQKKMLQKGMKSQIYLNPDNENEAIKYQKFKEKNKEEYFEEVMLFQYLSDIDTESINVPSFSNCIEKEENGEITLLIVMEKMGENLKQKSQKTIYQNMNIIRKVEYLVEIAERVQFVHEQGFAHCDIKLENFVKNQDDKIRIIDFGSMSDSGECREKKTFYRAPEMNQISEDQKKDKLRV